MWRPLIEKHRTSLYPPSPRPTPGLFPLQSNSARAQSESEAINSTTHKVILNRSQRPPDLPVLMWPTDAAAQSCKGQVVKWIRTAAGSESTLFNIRYCPPSLLKATQTLEYHFQTAGNEKKGVETRTESDRGWERQSRETAGRSGSNFSPQLLRALAANRCPLQQMESKPNTISVHAIKKSPSHNTSGPTIIQAWPVDKPDIGNLQI